MERRWATEEQLVKIEEESEKEDYWNFLMLELGVRPAYYKQSSFPYRGKIPDGIEFFNVKWNQIESDANTHNTDFDAIYYNPLVIKELNLLSELENLRNDIWGNSHSGETLGKVLGYCYPCNLGTISGLFIDFKIRNSKNLKEDYSLIREYVPFDYDIKKLESKRDMINSKFKSLDQDYDVYIEKR